MTPDEMKARCRAFSFEVVSIVLALGDDDLARLVRPQLLRAGTGVCTNYRASCRSRSKREFVSRLAVVVEEADESELWLDLLETFKREPAARIRAQRAEAIELRAICGRARSTAIENMKRARRPRSHDKDAP